MDKENSSAADFESVAVARRRPTRVPQPPLQELPRRPRVGAKVHRYQLIRELGRGGMGSVFLARDTRLGRLAAIKFLTLSRTALVKRFLAEARATALCNHENIVIIYDVDVYLGMPYMALEYLQGQTLRQMLKRARTQRRRDERRTENTLLSVERAVEIAVPVARALRRAHEMGIVHRDLKPGNVMLTSSGAVKVLDFGIAKAFSEQAGSDPEPANEISALAARFENPSVTRTGVLVGTLPYMAPEQLRSRDSVDPRSDIWAVGIMLYEMVTGKHPLSPLSKNKLLGVKNECLLMPSLSALRPDLHRFGQLVDRCLRKRRADRMATAAELVAELQRFSGTGAGRAVEITGEPFVGLAAFQETDAARFFGRSADIAAVVARVRDQPMVALVGPSGVGKSSLVRAGVIPALERSCEGWQALVTRPGRRPLTALVGLLAQLLFREPGPKDAPTGETATRESQRVLDSSPPMTRGAMRDLLVTEPGVLAAEMRAWAQHQGRRIVIYIDEFEAIYTADIDPAERAAFLSCLAAIGDDPSSPLRVIFAIRSDFLEHMAETREFMAIAIRGLIVVPAIDRLGLRAALTEPVRAAGYRFESETMITDILDAVDHTPGALPLLQFTAARLWAARDRDRRLLTENSYQSTGRVPGALARHADAVLAGMSGRQVALARHIFRRLVTPERTRASVTVRELRELAPGGTAMDREPGSDADDIQQVLRILTDARLLSIEIGGAGHERGLDSSTVELVHESLIESWTTLARWLDDNQADNTFLARLRIAATQWSQSDEAEGMLWRGDTEVEARHFSARYQGPLSERERRFLGAVFRLGERTARHRRGLLIGTLIGLIVVVAAAIFGLLFVRQVERKAHRHAEVEIQRARNAADEELQAMRELVAAMGRRIDGLQGTIVECWRPATSDRLTGSAEPGSPGPD